LTSLPIHCYTLPKLGDPPTCTERLHYRLLPRPVRGATASPGPHETRLPPPVMLPDGQDTFAVSESERFSFRPPGRPPVSGLRTPGGSYHPTPSAPTRGGRPARSTGRLPSKPLPDCRTH
jgi:hypothetical protein